MSRPLSTRFLEVNLRQMRAALDHHNETCTHAATAFRLHPYDRGLLPFNDLWGIPLVPDESVEVKLFKIDCPRPLDPSETAT